MPEIKENVVEVIPLIEKGQNYEIVDILKPEIERCPKNAKFLGMYNSSVENETVAADRSKKQGKKAGKKAGEKGKASSGINKNLDSLLKFDKNILGKNDKSKNQYFDQEEEEEGEKPLEDYYPDYAIGAHTYLNVLRFPDVDYFVRMKRQFKMTFNPVPVLKNHFLSNRVTRGSIDVVLAVSVEKSGKLSELFIIRSSGIDGYDHEAMRTIRASAPFAAPNEKFLEDDGLLRMSWTFTVYL